MQRLALLFLAAACGNGGNGYATVPPPDTGLVWPISVQCVRTMDFGEEVVTTTTYSPGDGKVNWVPGCTQGQQTNTWRCPAPPQKWWTTDGAKDTVRCILSPCQGIDPGRVVWAVYPNGSVVVPKQTPPTLPKKAMPGNEPTPQGGSDACLNPENSWVFAPPL